MKHLAVIIGTRPNLIKFATIEKQLRAHIALTVIDTEQHYDPTLSKDLRAEFALRQPDYLLDIGSAHAATQIGRMLIRLGQILPRIKPHAVVVFGDTNSALAGALAAVKVGLPVVHIEAGVRCGDRQVPEEVNRIVIDHIASVHFCPTKRAVDHLRREGITDGVYFVGDVLLELLTKANANQRVTVGNLPEDYYLLTMHRAQNTDSTKRIRVIFEQMASLDLPVVFPLHPRTARAMSGRGIHTPPNFIIQEPVGYHAMIELQRRAVCVITDSGGIQREAYYLGKPCVVLRDVTEWPETLTGGFVRTIDLEREHLPSVVKRLLETRKTHKKPRPSLFRPRRGVSEAIIKHIKQYLEEPE